MKKMRLVPIAALAALAVTATGCSLGGSSDIDPPPKGYEISAMNGDALTASADAAQSMSATAYFLDPNGLVAPVSIHVPKSNQTAQSVLSYMVDGGPGASQLPKGFRALLPKGTQIKGIDIKQDQKLAIVDFSNEFTQYNPQDERKMLEAVTWALTGFPTIEQVLIRVNGTALEEMPQDGFPLSSTLNRHMLGINIEKAQEVDYGTASPVTLYFLSKTKDQKTYYVPVTRLIPQTDDVVKATVAELIKGPMKPALSSAFLPDTQMKNASLSGDLVTVDFNDKLLGTDKLAHVETLQTLVLSVTENTGAKKVQVEVNGEAKVNATDHSNYSVPVERPVRINDIKL